MSDNLRNTFRHACPLYMNAHGSVFSPCGRLVALFLLWRYGTRQAMWNENSKEHSRGEHDRQDEKGH